MHPPSAAAAAARPLPKRTRSSAGLEDVETWFGPVSSASGGAVPPPPPSSSSLVMAPLGGHSQNSSRKRHHSLPAAMIPSNLIALPSSASANQKNPTSGTHANKLTFQPMARRPGLPVFFSDHIPDQQQQQQQQQQHHQSRPLALSSPSCSSISSRRFSNQYSPSLHGNQLAHSPSLFHAAALAAAAAQETGQRTPGNDASAIVASLQPPEMSPREDYLVRAFVSDAMKIEGDDAPTPRGHGRFPLSTPGLGMEEDSFDDGGDDDMQSGGLTTAVAAAAALSTTIKWSRDEDERLRDAVARFGGKNWKMIAETLGHGRTDVQCLHRWNKVLKPGLVKGPWTPEEDRVLLNLIARYGVGKIRWCDVALHLPGRIGKQCRERWCNHLDSSIRKGQWTHEEDEAVFRLQQTLGNKWSEIAKMLPGRTENAVKNRFNSAARRKWLISQTLAKGPLATPTGSSSVKFALANKSTRLSPSPLQPSQNNQPHVQQTRAPAPAPPPSSFAYLGRGAPTSSSSYTASARLAGHAQSQVRGSELLATGLLAGPPRPPSSASSSCSSAASPMQNLQQQQQQQMSSGAFRGAGATATGGPFTASRSSPFTSLDAASVRDGDMARSGLFPYIADGQPFSRGNGHPLVFSDTMSDFGSPPSTATVRPSAVGFSFAGSTFQQQQQQQQQQPFRPQFLHTPASSPSLSALLSSPQQQQQHDPFSESTDYRLGDGNASGNDGDEETEDSNNNDNQDEDDTMAADDYSPDAAPSPSPSPWRFARPSKPAAYQDGTNKQTAAVTEPQVEEENLSLVVPPHPSDDGDGSHEQLHSGGSPGSSSVMDDQNMSTFLDSVALELDDII